MEKIDQNSDVLYEAYEKALLMHETVEDIPKVEKIQKEKTQKTTTSKLKMKKAVKKPKMVLPPPPPPVPPPFPSISPILMQALPSVDDQQPMPSIASIHSNEDLEKLLKKHYQAGYQAAMALPHTHTPDIDNP